MARTSSFAEPHNENNEVNAYLKKNTFNFRNNWENNRNFTLSLILAAALVATLVKAGEKRYILEGNHLT